MRSAISVPIRCFGLAGIRHDESARSLAGQEDDTAETAVTRPFGSSDHRQRIGMCFQQAKLRTTEKRY
jgi:hypothetical protein